VGDGNNHWPLIYDRDLADLYVRIAAREDALGVYHANDEGDERVNDIVDAIAPYVSVRPDVRHVPLDEARSKMGAVAEALALDQLVRSPRARAIGWAPTLHSVAGNAARLLEEWRASRNNKNTAGLENPHKHLGPHQNSPHHPSQPPYPAHPARGAEAARPGRPPPRSCP